MSRETKAEKAEREQAKAYLLEDYELKRGDTLYFVIRDVARSGMSRTMSVFIVKDGGLYGITHLVAKVCGYPLTRGGDVAFRVHGCGMDMRFHVASSLAVRLFGDPYALEYRGI